MSGHRLIALVEMVSPGNKDRSAHLEEFVTKVASALHFGVHLLVVDLFPPGTHDLHGIHGAILGHLQESDAHYDLPADEPMTLAAYAAGTELEAYVEHLGVGHALPEMPLFLQRDRYINVPLAHTYQAAYGGMPSLLARGPRRPQGAELNLTSAPRPPNVSRMSPTSPRVERNLVDGKSTFPGHLVRRSGALPQALS